MTPTTYVSSEEILPTYYVLHGISRLALANHLRWLRLRGRRYAKTALYQTHWVGVYPMKPLDVERLRQLANRR